MPTQQQIIEHYVQAYNAFDIDSMLRDLHPDIVFENVTQGKVDLKTEGLDAFQQQAETAKMYFSARQQHIVDWTFTNETVIISIDYHGVLAIDLPNGLKAGDILNIQGQSTFTFKGGKIIGIRDSS